MRTFEAVTPAVFACVKAVSERDHGTIYSPQGGDRGTATTRSAFWIVVVSFDLNRTAGRLTYMLDRKTWFVPTSAIWSGIADTLAVCR